MELWYWERRRCCGFGRSAAKIFFQNRGKRY
nr:MAG TPA: hypothetical protein [Caudoviricetes sp.]